MKRQILALVAAGAVLFAACGDASTESGDTAAPETTAGGTETTAASTGGDAKACAEGKTLEAGSLTIATGDPAFPPYVPN